MTGNQIVNEALLVVGRIFPGQTCSTDEQTTSQLGLNNLLDEWNATGLAVYSVARTTPFALTSGTADYTIGTGGTIAITRPVKIEGWAVQATSGQSSAGKPVDAQEFLAIATDRSAIGARIKALNYDAAYPTASIHLYPKPNGGLLELWIWEQLPQITDFTQVYALPPGYGEALIYNLAVALAPKFRVPLDQTIKLKADETRMAIGKVNTSEHESEPPAAPAGR
jgi:hypothetical protein